MKTLEEKIKFLETYINDRDKHNKFTNEGGFDNEYCWKHTGLSNYYKGKLSALKEIKNDIS